MGITRRDFMKGGLIAGAAMAAVPTLLIRKALPEWAKRSAVHPDLNNLRVVGITDPRMTKSVETGISWRRQEELTAAEPVWENIDKLACGLAETKNPRDAWQGIFIKPPRKGWSDTVVAVKTNHIALQHTRSAVMAKICHTLTEVMGVKASNIFIYDGVHGRGMSGDTPFAGLPKGCRIVDQWGGISTPVAVSSPWSGSPKESECVKALADGTVDILVNISLCKGHSSIFGGFTMTMKNHFGSFSPDFGHRDGADNYLIAINKTPEILGSMDRRTGKVLFPRQQLCLVDALWASKGGPGGMPSHQPNFLAMGVFSPVLDFLLATRFRGEKMGWRPNPETTRRFLTDFGYKESDLPNGGRIIEL